MPAPGAWASAAASAGSVGLAQALEAAWHRTLGATASQGDLRRAEAARRAATGAWAAPPALELGARSDRFHRDDGASEYEVGVSVPLWLPGQRGARLAVAEAEQAMAVRRAAADRLALAGDVRDAAWSLAALEAEAAASATQQRYLRSLGEDVARRVQAGELARSDALAAQGEVLASQAEELDVRQRLQAARLRWQSLTGLDAVPQPEEALQDPAAVPAEHPALALADQAVEAARRQREAVRRDRADAPELAVSWRQERAERGAGLERTVGVVLRVPFGGDQRNEPLAAASQAALDQALAEQQRLRLQQAAERRAAEAALAAAQQQLETGGARSALLRERARLIDASFRAGETALPDLLLAAEAAARAEAALARHHAALGLARARLHQALGVMP